MNRPEPPPIVQQIPQGIPVGQPVVVPVIQATSATQPARTKRHPLLNAMRWVTVAWAAGMPVVFILGFAMAYVRPARQFEGLDGRMHRLVPDLGTVSEEVFLAMAFWSGFQLVVLSTGLFAVTMIVLFVLYKTR